MKQPEEPELLVHLPAGNAYYKVVDTGAGWNGNPVITVVAGKWLDAGTYRAVLVEGAQRTSGTYCVHTCKSDGDRIRFIGSFTPEKHQAV